MSPVSNLQFGRLCTRNQTETFGPGPPAAGQFARALQEQHAATTRHVLRHPRDLLLDAEGHLPTQRTLTTVAMGQISRILAPGLAALLSTLSGRPDLRYTAREQRSDLALAIRTYNDVVKLRFARIEGYSLLTDTRTRSIDGVLGPRYEWLSNYDLYERSSRFVQANLAEVRFYEAALCGRRMLLRYCRQSVLLSAQTADGPVDPFRQGLHFGNSEVGECALHITTLLVRQQGGTSALGGPLDGGKVMHVRGPKFGIALQQLFERVRQKSIESQTLRTNIARLIDVPLGLGKNTDQHRKRLASLLSQLIRAGLGKRLALRVLSRTAAVGSYADRPESRTAALLSTRTAYDLFNAITYEARAEALASRERAEHAAYQLLRGTWLLKF